MNTPRIIKKYPNRRLYDTTISSYITLDEIKELVLNHEPFQVIDTRTEQDITHATLLQIISEQEEKSPNSLFSTELLQDLIRSYGNSMQDLFSEFLAQGIKTLIQQQNQLQNSVQQLMGGNPLKTFQEMTQQNMQFFNDFQKSWLDKIQDKQHTEDKSK